MSPNDEFADYGTWDKGSFGPEPKTPDMLPREYAREALKRGMKYEETLGANPFKFGMIGSTDTHTSLSTTEENNYFGKATPAEPSAERRAFRGERSPAMSQEPDGPDITMRHFQTLAAGLAAVWATDNTREALWDAVKRKEVYATTGTRMTVRVFAGWDFEEPEVQRPDFARNGYLRGVPMGGDLRNAADGKAPTFMIRALRDVDGANLDRVQIVKGWLDGEGELQEQVYDVLCSDDRAINNEHRCDTPVGNTVDVEQATFTNSIGDALMLAYWKDPAFDPKQRAFYYVRVLEIPTPRWTTYDAAFFGVALPRGCSRPNRNGPTRRQSGTRRKVEPGPRGGYALYCNDFRQAVSSGDGGGADVARSAHAFRAKESRAESFGHDALRRRYDRSRITA